MNKERLIELRNFFAGCPEEKVDMISWSYDDPQAGNNEDYSCLTAGCLAGWGAVYKPFVELGFHFKKYGNNWMPTFDGYIGEHAFANFFDLDYWSARYLTLPVYYSDKDRDTRGKIRKDAVLARLDHLIMGNKLIEELVE